MRPILTLLVLPACSTPTGKQGGAPSGVADGISDTAAAADTAEPEPEPDDEDEDTADTGDSPVGDPCSDMDDSRVLTLELDDTIAGSLCEQGRGLRLADLVVGRSYTGTDLSPLWCVCAIDGGIWISEAPALETLDGLHHLEEGELADGALTDLVVQQNPRLRGLRLPPSVEVINHAEASDRGFLIVQYNSALEALDLPALRSIRQLRIDGNPRITDLSGLSALEEVQDVAEVRYNQALTGLEMAGLQRIGTLNVYGNASLSGPGSMPALREIGRLSIGADTGLWSFEGWEGLEQVGDGFTIAGLPGITRVTFAGLDGLQRIGGDLDVSGVIPSLAGLGTLQEIGGQLALEGEVRSLTGLHALERVGGLYLDDVTSLTTLRGLDALSEVTGSVRLFDLPDLERLDGLESLQQVGGRVEILNATALSSIEGLSALEEVQEGFSLSRSPLLGSLAGLESLRIVRGSVHLVETAIPDIKPLSSLRRLGGLYLSANPELVNLGPLPSGNYEEVHLHANNRLGNLTGLNAVRTVTGDLYLWGNTALGDVSALHGVTWVGGHMTIRRNTALAANDARRLIEAIGESNIGGIITVGENGP